MRFHNFFKMTTLESTKGDFRNEMIKLSFLSSSFNSCQEEYLCSSVGVQVLVFEYSNTFILRLSDTKHVSELNKVIWCSSTCDNKSV